MSMMQDLLPELYVYMNILDCSSDLAKPQVIAPLLSNVQVLQMPCSPYTN